MCKPQLSSANSYRELQGLCQNNVIGILYTLLGVCCVWYNWINKASNFNRKSKVHYFTQPYKIRNFIQFCFLKDNKVWFYICIVTLSSLLWKALLIWNTLIYHYRYFVTVCSKHATPRRQKCVWMFKSPINLHQFFH